MNISNKIKEIRTQSTLSQEEFASKLGISKNAIWNYENNKRKPPLDLLYKISHEFDIPIGELLDIKDKDIPILSNTKTMDMENKINKENSAILEFISGTEDIESLICWIMNNNIMLKRKFELEFNDLGYSPAKIKIYTDEAMEFSKGLYNLYKIYAATLPLNSDKKLSSNEYVSFLKIANKTLGALFSSYCDEIIKFKTPKEGE